eukprot:m.53611 g.53611  ORF g.53611 m.53611 type:complete len:162 (+) comp10874_c0_seq2:121-606(+)
MSTSTWNKAGTWEERDCSQWAKDVLTTKLGAITCDHNEHTVKVSSVKSVTGNANILHARGKNRIGLEISFELSWEAVKADGKSADGTIKVTEMDETDVDDMDLQVIVKNNDGIDKNQAKKLGLALKSDIKKAFTDMMAEKIAETSIKEINLQKDVNDETMM